MAEETDTQSIRARLNQPVQFEVTEWIPLLDGGLAAVGWMVDPLECVLRIQITSGDNSRYLDNQNCIWFPDSDVQRTLAPALGVTDRDCGFMVMLRDFHRAGDPLTATIETTLGKMPYSFRPLQPRAEMASIKLILNRFDLKYSALANAFDRVIGPTVESLNRARLLQRPFVTETAFGSQPRLPTTSVVIPLHTRIDYMEHQLAQFSADDMRNVELIYILDDPAQRHLAETLCESCYARFGTPFRLLALDRNVGYGAASNIGAGHARGRFLCFLNSDVFPCEAGWLPSLRRALVRSPVAGIVGPRLIYEDGSLQHDGCAYEENPALAGWHFVTHPGKALIPPPPTGIKPVAAVTGACLLLRADLFAAIGGFDERYAIGDFEDSDLCQKVRQCGLQCIVDDRIVLFHLERGSQVSGTERWRSNLTLYNAWQHERRWATVAGAFDEMRVNPKRC